MTRQKKILVAPLNWGLGHATRCVPIIREFQKQKAIVLLGGDGMALAYLQAEFPELQSIHIPDLKVRYPKSGGYLLYFAMRIPRLLAHVRKENLLLRKLVRRHEIDGIISDNRYGLYHRHKPCVLITHQLFIETPTFKKTVHSIVKKLIAKFNVCWVPDTASSDNLSGRLSHAENSNSKVKFIGPVSRFSNQKKKKNLQRKILAVLSGPEPFRMQLERLLIERLSILNYDALIVRGVITENNSRKCINEKLETIDYLSADELLKETELSDIVIARSGYSSIMDLVALHQKALLIPTPGQTEQEYLSHHLINHPLFVFSNQESLNLEDVLTKLERKPESNSIPFPSQEEHIKSFLSTC